MSYSYLFLSAKNKTNDVYAAVFMYEYLEEQIQSEILESIFEKYQYNIGFTLKEISPHQYAYFVSLFHATVLGNSNLNIDIQNYISECIYINQENEYAEDEEEDEDGEDDDGDE